MNLENKPLPSYVLLVGDVMLTYTYKPNGAKCVQGFDICNIYSRHVTS